MNQHKRQTVHLTDAASRPHGKNHQRLNVQRDPSNNPTHDFILPKPCLVKE